MELKKWVASYAGCDGGSPSESSIWFVGIEWGYGKDLGQTGAERDNAVREYHSGSMLDEIKSGWSDPIDDKYSPNDHTHYTFGRNSAKLMSAIKGADVREYHSVVKSLPDTDVFKLNLYPIGLPNTDDFLWSKFDLSAITGLSTKQDYREYCAEHRFPFFRSNVDRYSPGLCCVLEAHMFLNSRNASWVQMIFRG